MKSTRLRLALAAAVVAAFAVTASGALTAPSDDTVVKGDAAVDAGMALEGPLMVELAGEPAAVTYAEARERGASKEEAGNAAKARKEANEQQQQRMLTAAKDKGINATPIYQVQTSYNGVAVNAGPGAAADLAALPGSPRCT